MAAKILIIGAGGHGRVVLEALRSAGRKPSFLDGALRGRTIDGAKVEGGDELLDVLPPTGVVLAVGVGASPDVAARRDVYEAASAKGFRLPPVVAASAPVSKLALLEDGAQILTRAVVHPGAVIGVNAVVNTGAIVEHDAVVGAHAFVGPGAVLLGACRIGAGAFIGAGAVVLPGTTVGPDSIVGAGAVVTAEVPARARVAGVPARRLGR